jgi:plasmid stability protein
MADGAHGYARSGYYVAHYQAPRTERDWEVPQRQANIRLDDQLFEQIEVAAFVHRRSFADEMRAALIAWVEAHEADPLIRSASKSRQPIPQPDGAAVHQLNPKRRRGGDGNG